MHEELFAFMSVSRSVLLRMGHVSDKIVEKTKKTHFMFSKFIFENHVTYVIIWKNIVDADRPQITI